MASEKQMKDPLRVGVAIRAQLEREIPRDLPLERDFREGTDYTITDQYVQQHSLCRAHVSQPPPSVNGLHDSLVKDPRKLQLIKALVNHLHTFARQTLLTHDEWLDAIKFLTRTGKESTDYKNEFILLSDILGFSALVDEVTHPKPSVCPNNRAHAHVLRD